MLNAKDVLNELRLKGFTFFTGVPCSFLKPFINCVIESHDVNYIIAPNEGDAVSMAVGAYLAGSKCVVLCQNSGLGNMVNPMTSLNYPFKIPFLLFVTLRGEIGIGDEPQHELMGQITSELLSTLRIPWDFLPSNIDNIPNALSKAQQNMNALGVPFAFIIKKGLFEKYHSNQKIDHSKPNKIGQIFGTFSVDRKNMPRIKAIELIKDSTLVNDALVFTTGKIGREAFSLGDSSNQIYIIGSMGCASGIGFGIHNVIPKKRVIVFDGDGAAIMRMGIFSVIGYYRPKNFVHVILDNESYESTGGQTTTSTTTDFTTIAAACGYNKCWRVEEQEFLKQVVPNLKMSDGPYLLHIKVANGSVSPLLRPNLSPMEVKNRFMYFLRNNKDC